MTERAKQFIAKVARITTGRECPYCSQLGDHPRRSWAGCGYYGHPADIACTLYDLVEEARQILSDWRGKRDNDAANG